MLSMTIIVYVGVGTSIDLFNMSLELRSCAQDSALIVAKLLHNNRVDIGCSSLRLLQKELYARVPAWCVINDLIMRLC